MRCALRPKVFGDRRRRMSADEEATHKTFGAYREIIDGPIARHDGRVFSTAGDSVVAEFASADNENGILVDPRQPQHDLAVCGNHIFSAYPLRHDPRGPKTGLNHPQTAHVRKTVPFRIIASQRI